jgi:hypothetical protein
VLIRRGLLGAHAVDELTVWAGEIEAWPVGSHRWGHYAERTPTGPAVCRTENVSPCHAGIAGLVTGILADAAADAIGEPVTAFKDKINFKRPGGAGFSPHQDQRAYPGVQRVLSLLVAVDPCTPSSGCVWIADGVDRLLPADERGVVTPEAAAALYWEAANLEPGDALCIDGLLPHHSGANGSTRPRRVLVASYAPTAEGYSREDYYARRHALMVAAPVGDHRISATGDFDGVTVGPMAGTACRHG